MKSYSYLFGFLAAGFLAVGCAKPPTMEMADAESAVNAAAQAGAADFAAAQFEVAQNALNDARAKLASKDYKGALTSALDAKTKAEAAQAAIEAGKAAAKAAADEATKAVAEKLKDLKALAAKAKGATATTLKNSIKEIEAEWTTVMEDSMNGNYTKVNNAAASVSNRIETLKQQAEEAAKSLVKTVVKKAAK